MSLKIQLHQLTTQTLDALAQSPSYPCTSNSGGWLWLSWIGSTGCLLPASTWWSNRPIRTKGTRTSWWRRPRPAGPPSRAPVEARIRRLGLENLA